jgi:phosphonate transport system substrate-binding protein
MAFASSDQTSVKPTQQTAEAIATLLENALATDNRSTPSPELPTKLVVRVLDASSIVSLMEHGGVDIAWLDPADYELLHVRNDAVPITKMDDYSGLFIVREALGLRTLKDLKNRPVAFGPDSSVPSTIFPLRYLKDQANLRKSDVISIPEANEDAIVLAVCQGKADAGGIYNDARISAPKQACMQPTNPLVTMTPLPGDPQVVSTRLSSGLIKALQSALENVGSDQAGRQALANLYGINQLYPASDANYKDFLSTLRAVEPTFVQ